MNDTATCLYGQGLCAFVEGASYGRAEERSYENVDFGAGRDYLSIQWPAKLSDGTIE